MEGEAAPWYYGFSYRLYTEAAIVCYPVPFNFIMRWAHHSWDWLRRKGVDRKNEAYLAGYEAGRREGERHGAYNERERIRTAMNEEIENMRKKHA